MKVRPFGRLAWPSRRNLPSFLLIGYVLCIPGFAFVFWSVCPGDFYAPYAHLEPTWQGEELRAAGVLETTLERASKDHLSKRSKITLEEYRLLDKKLTDHMVKIEHLRVFDVRTDGKSLSFQVAFEVQAEPDAVAGPSGLVDIDLSVSGRLITPASAPEVLEIPTEFSIAGFHPGAIIGELQGPHNSIETFSFQSLFRPTFFDEGKRVIYLDEAEANTLRVFFDECTGVSYGIGGSYPRMLYFSIVVITTLGLGDIVPLTWLARILVGGEAVIGVLIAGLFFYAISRPPN
jgi:hypothetical protein